MSRFVRWTAATAAVLLVAGCSNGTSKSGDDKGSGAVPPPSATSSSRASPELPASLTSQKLDWSRCEGTSDSPTPGSDWQCATLKAPLDYAKPGGETIGLSLIRAQGHRRQPHRVPAVQLRRTGPVGHLRDALLRGHGLRPP